MPKTFLGSPIPSAPSARSYRLTIDRSVFPYLNDHHLNGRPVLPGAVYVEMALAMAASLGDRAVCLTAIKFQRAAFLNTDRPLVLDAVLETEPEGAALFRVFGSTADRAHATPHVTMRLRPCPENEETSADLAGLRRGSANALPPGRFYDELRTRGNDYGPAFQGIAQMWRGDREAIASVHVPAARTQDIDGFLIHPVLLDSCMQLALAVEDTREMPAFLVSMDSLRFRRSPGAACWAHAHLKAANGPAGDTVADIRLMDESGEILVELSGVRFRGIAAARPAAREAEGSQLTVAISATFTAEPLADSLAFWMRELNIPVQIVFAPYNQPFQQLLDPHSVLATNRNGLNVMLVRVEDWTPSHYRPTIGSGPGAATTPLDGTQYILPNGLAIAHLNQYETDYLYQEIFRDEVYLRHGITLGDGDCVIDVGANIGLFTLFVLGKCRQARVYAFEPSPAAFDSLARNVAPHGDQVKVFNVGLSDHDGNLPLTVYRNSTLFSGYHAHEDQDRASMEAVIRNVLRDRGERNQDTVQRFAGKLVDTRMESETITSRVRTLASIIEEQNLDRIDLLKIDAEKSELATLKGLREGDWKIIRQIVIEVHDADGEAGPRVRQMLEAHGFTVTFDQEPMLRDSSLSTLYAIRPTTSVSPEKNIAAGAADDTLDRSASDFIHAMTSAAARSSSPYLVCLCPPSTRVLRNAALRGRVHAIETRLATELAPISGVQVLTAQDILEKYPVPDYEDTRADDLGHMPYTRGFYAALSTVIARRLHLLWRLPYKVIVLDCDETLWRGRCGEDRPEALQIDSGHRALQEFMRRQHEAGMLLALCSRNNEADVLAVFMNRPEMPLTLEHFVAHRINWNRKSENVAALAAELGLSLDSFIFIDDDRIECAEMRARRPDVLTLELPAEADQIPHLLDHVWAFDHAAATVEDAERPSFYRQERQRSNLRQSSLTFADFLASLEVRVRIAAAEQADVPRIAELSMRTNQFNVTGIRRTESEIRDWLQAKNAECVVVDVSDRFGRYGIVGTILFAIGADALQVDTFLLSCRALGRCVEHRMLAWLGELAIDRGRDRVDVPFVPSGRNHPALMFLQEAGNDFIDFPTGDDERAGRVFKFPARNAAKLTYAPPEPALQPAASDASPKDTRSASMQDSDRRTPASVFHHIAMELDQVDRILAASRRRNRKEHPAADAPAEFGDDMARTVADVWRDVLGIDTVGVSDNLAQLGATSLDVALAVAELERRLNLDIPLVNFLDQTTVGSMTQLLKNHGQTDLKKDLETSRLRGEQRRAQRLGRPGQR
jgi:FkbH-like protein/FkbM family methyltransferase